MTVSYVSGLLFGFKKNVLCFYNIYINPFLRIATENITFTRFCFSRCNISAWFLLW